MTAVNEKYSGGYGEQVLAELNERSAAVEAAFFLPHLNPEMRLLDCGCGPGAITCDLAGIVREVVGMDIESSQFPHEKPGNLRFSAGSVYQLPFRDEAFDAVFAHAVLYHLREPQRALAEMYRVLKPGGVIGIRDFDLGGTIMTPTTPILERAEVLFHRAMTYYGADVYFGRNQGRALREAGFVNVIPSASYDNYGTPDVTRRVASFLADMIQQSDIADAILSQGWAARDDLTAFAAAYLEWGDHPDAFSARARCEAVAWKPN